MRHSWQVNLILICVLILSFSGCVHYRYPGQMTSKVRVAIVENAKSVTVTGIIKKTFRSQLKISTNDKLPVIIKGKHSIVEVNGKQYHGDIEVQLINNTLWVINILDIECYLQGVVPCEIGRISAGLLEAAKAQAVAARTYACAHIGQYESQGFDLYSTIRDQVYKGISCETDLTNEAVQSTKGEILTYKGRPIEAKYHSTCGGRTAHFNDAWPGTPPPYLSSVECPYCEKSPHFQWQKEYAPKEFYLKLRAKLQQVGTVIPDTEYIKTIILIRNKTTKRILRMEIMTAQHTYSIPGYKLRTVFGDYKDPGGLLKSNWVDMEYRDGKIILHGYGFGHGVGMCQFGAIEMSRQGKTYKQILFHYYSGVKLTKIR